MLKEAVILAQDLTKHYRVALKGESLLATLRHFLFRQYRTVKAVEGVGFRIERGEVV
ncbi:MAG: ABC transporter, partial [Desulfatiglandales bacterium]